MRSILFALVIGLAGVAVLLSLGVWQLRRLEWKEGLIATAETMMTRPATPLPATPDPAVDRYLPVSVSGRFTGDEAHVLTADRFRGPGFLVIAGFETADGRRILIDRGYVPEAERRASRPAKAADVTGNLNWPDDMTPSTPPHDEKTGIWFGRDLPGIAAALGTEPLLVIARSDTGDGVTPVPAAATFRNDHLQYAITWFLLAAVWAGMTLAYLWRIRQRKA